MFNKEDILKELAAGKSIEEIAQDAADALNTAKAEYDETMKRKAEAEAKRKAEEAAKKEAEKKLALQKETRMGNLFSDLFDYFVDFYPDVFGNFKLSDFYKAADPKSVAEAFDKAVAEVRAIPEVAKNVKGDDKNWCVKLEGEDAKKAGSAIQKFLKENGLF